MGGGRRRRGAKDEVSWRDRDCFCFDVLLVNTISGKEVELSSGGTRRRKKRRGRKTTRRRRIRAVSLLLGTGR